MRVKGRAIPLFAIATLIGPAVGAQERLGDHDSMGVDRVDLADYRCLDTLSAAVMTRVPVLLRATVEEDDSTNHRLQPQFDLLAQEVALELNSQLGTSPDSLPPARAQLTWRGVPAGIRVIAHGIGPVEIQPSSSPRRAGDAARALLIGALQAVIARDSTLVVWPEHVVDSAVASIDLDSPMHDSASRAPLPTALRGFRVFSLDTPWEEPAVPPKKGMKINYPKKNLDARVVGEVTFTFVVDSTGRLMPETLHDLWPKNKPPFEGAQAQWYQEFLRSGREGLLRAGPFTPARIGGCRVRQLVQQPLAFGIR